MKFKVGDVCVIRYNPDLESPDWSKRHDGVEVIITGILDANDDYNYCIKSLVAGEMADTCARDDELAPIREVLFHEAL